MLDLEAKLNACMFENLGQQAETEQEGCAKDARRLAVQSGKAIKVNIAAAQEQPKAEEVRFIKRFDAIPALTRQSADKSMHSPSSPKPENPANAMEDIIAEHFSAQNPAIPSNLERSLASRVVAAKYH